MLVPMKPEPRTQQDDKPPSSGIRVLVIVLLVQLLLAGVLIYFALAGWAWVPSAPAQGSRPLVSERFRSGNAGDGVPTPRVNNFNQKLAFKLLRRQVDRYGWRPAGSASSQRLALDLRDRLPAGALAQFTAGGLQLSNVVGVIAGRLPAVVVAAHYDVEARTKGFVGANDGAAGSAAVVELARSLAARPIAGGREVRFVLFDGEEEPAGSSNGYANGLRGSRAYLARHRAEVGELILLDYIANRGLRLPREATSNRQLWTKLRAAAARSGTAASFPNTSGAALYDDHTPFLEAGIAAIDLIDFEYPWRDTLADTVDKLSPRALDVTGETVYSLVDELRRR